MTVSAYQVDNVIKAYNKQQKTRLRGIDASSDTAKNRGTDIVTLSGSGTEEPGQEALTKISYSLLDILTKQKK